MKDVDPLHDALWRYLRGDWGLDDLRVTVVDQPGTREALGEGLHQHLFIVDESSPEALAELRERLRTHARSTWPHGCECAGLADRDVIDMGAASNERMRTIVEIHRCGPPRWWLSLSRCHVCMQWWLIGADERHNDVYCLRRLDEALATAVMEEDRWPPDFDTYETVLRLGREAGARVSFCDPLGDSSLAWTIADLARARPGIAVRELAELLNLDLALARVLAVQVRQAKGLTITDDQDDEAR